MNKDSIVMGIDTSNYTTSVALVTLDGRLVANIKAPLPVKAGECGLRQSDAVFAHIKNIPECMARAREALDGRVPIAIGVSKRPRNIEGSYMPCFLSGVSVAEGISASLGIPIHYFSHQCGHVMSALYSSGNIHMMKKEFGAFHVSGGTTDLLRITPSENGFCAERVGGTSDLNAGQAIDRIGVSMGLAFPCGAELEALALQNTAKIPSKKVKCENLKIALSGLENMAERLLSETKDKALVSAFALDYIYNGISALADAYIERYGAGKLIFSGGVMSNSIIKNKICERYDAGFAEPSLSADNAVGIAVLTSLKF